MDRIKLFIDTDIGDDIDDLQALTLALVSPEVELVGVTTVWGNTLRRAKLVRKLLEAAGRGDVPVAAGTGAPLLHPGRATTFDGHNLDLGSLEKEPLETPGPLMLAEAFQEDQGTTVLLTLGALTNVALALHLDSRLPGKIRRYFMMGGCFGARAELRNRLEYNIRCDPEAAAVVFSTGFDLTIVGLDVTTQVELPRAHLDPLRTSNHPLARLYVSAVEDYLSLHSTNRNIPHDALTLAALLRPELLATEELQVGVELCGDYTRGTTLGAQPPSCDVSGFGPAKVAVRVDAPAFREFYLERLYRLCEE